MTDYINRKDVMELLSRLKATAERMNDPTVNIAFAMRGIVDAAGAYEIVERLVGKLPSADVVPVVCAVKFTGCVYVVLREGA